MKVDKELIENVARVARLKLTDSEIKKFIPPSEFRDVDITRLGEAIKASGASLAITGCGC